MRKKTSAKPTRVVAGHEYPRFAERFAELILDTRQPWMIQYFLAGGFEVVPSEQEMMAGGFALSVLNRMDRDWLAPTWLTDALFQGDQDVLAAYLKERMATAQLTKDHMELLPKIADPLYFRQSLRELVAPFKLHRGAQPKLAVNAKCLGDSRISTERLSGCLRVSLETP